MAYKGKTIFNPVSGQSIRFLQASADTEGELLEMESVYAPNSPEPAAHYHPKQSEEFMVTAGRLCLRINGRIKHLSAGEQLEVRAGTVHSMWNPFDNAATVNWKVKPALGTEYFLETIMGLAANGRVNKKGLPPFLQTVLIARRYGNVLRLARPPYFLQRIVFGLASPVAGLMGYKACYPMYID